MKYKLVATSVEKQYGGSSRITNRTITQSINYTFDIQLKKRNTLIWKDICSLMFVAALFTVANIWIQYKCPWMNKWIKKWDGDGERNGSPLQYSCLENSVDRGDWWAIRVTKTWTPLSNTHTHTHTHIHLPTKRMKLCHLQQHVWILRALN